ncbi:MAG: hypothetical protein CTY25_06580 [Methylobacterium sp.]|nr:MAG: hypothetical protein CTY25_06580 [Methylobacterium sp.]
MPAMSQMTKPAFAHMLGALDRILDKLAAHCEAKKVEPGVYLGLRLYPDMFALTRQVQIACDFAKGAVARLSGRENPAWTDTETTIPELKERIAKTLAYIASVPDSEIDGSEERTITLKIRGQDMSFPGLTYVNFVVLPNFYFHLSTAYGILRNAGLEIGKNDFLGRT